MVKIYIPDSWLDVESPDFKADLAQHAFLAELRTAVKSVTDDVIEYSGIANHKLSLTFAKQLHAMGVIITEYPTWIEIESEDSEVPVGVFDRTYVDEDNEEQVHTWATWKLSNHTFTEIGERLFIGSNAHTNEDLTFEQLSGVLDDLVSGQTINELQAEQVVDI